MAGHHRHDRQRVQDAAVDQHPIALHHWSKQAWNRRRGAHRLVQAAFLEPDFLLVGQVGGDGGVGNAQVFDVDFTDDFANLAKHLLAANRPQAEADVHQPQHIQVVQAFDPLPVFLELAGRVDAADHGAHGAPGNAGDVVAATFKFLDDPDMRIATCASGTQDQRYSFAHVVPLIVGLPPYARSDLAGTGLTLLIQDPAALSCGRTVKARTIDLIL